MGYTKIECPTEQRNAGEFCDLSLNNCADGFKCQKVNDVCNDANITVATQNKLPILNQ